MWQCDHLSIAKATTFYKRPLIQNTKLLPTAVKSLAVGLGLMHTTASR